MFNRLTTKKTVIALAMAAVLPVGYAASGNMPSTSLVRTTEVRNSVPLTQNWKFIQNDLLTDDQALTNNVTNWSDVSLPHTWNATDAATTAQSSPTTPSYKRGIGWYRLEFDSTNSNAATQWLQFDGASIVADVWLNGEKLGQHKGAFTAFRFDVTGKLKPSKNVLFVKTNNSKAKSDSDPTAVAPLGGDFNMSGGLYRGVSLISTPSTTHFALDDFGSSGIFVRTTSINNSSATVNVLAKLKNDAKVDGSYIVQASLLEADGNTLKKSIQKKDIYIKAGTHSQASVDLNIDQAHLWQGVADPYLYKLVVELKSSAGTTIDKVVQDIGIRQMYFDPNKGLLLNGKSTPLHGVNLHQDMLGKGWAINQSDIDKSFAFIKELGANTVRLAHYPHSDYTLQQADKLGLVVWAELPIVDNTSVTPLVDPESTGFATNAREQLTELIRQQYNHSSIGIWSIANEVKGGTDSKNNVQSLFKSLNQLAKTEDPDRITTLAHQITRRGDTVLPNPLMQTGYTDSYNVNRYFQWYYGTSETQLGENLDDLHVKNPTQPIGLSEYGAGAAITHHTDNVYGGRVCARDGSGSTRICYQPEEYANYVHEKAYNQISSRKYLMGFWIWNMFDFGSGVRHEGDIGQTNTKGLITFGRDIKKDSFYFYKANWTKTPVTYITGRRYTERAYPITDVKVYSNADSVALKVNSKIISTKSAADCPLKVCEFKNIRLQEGNNSITAIGTHSSTTINDVVNWNLPTENLNNIFIAAGQLTTGFMSSDQLLGNHRYGSDNFFVGGEPPQSPASPSGYIGLSGDIAINGLGNASVPEVGRVWDMWREGGSFSYQIPLANGTYKVILGFLEPEASAVGARLFNVDANGVNQISGLDILSSTGTKNTAMVKSFLVDVINGSLKLDFNGVKGKAIVSNIAIARQ